jgi:hypothetical protein
MGGALGLAFLLMLRFECAPFWVPKMGSGRSAHPDGASSNCEQGG